MVIFLAGAHGVGKTFLGKPAAESLGFLHATASSLILNMLDGERNWDSDKCTESIDDNQQALVTAVDKIQEIGDVTLVLDGHFVLRNKVGEIEKISPDVFKRLGISSIILIESPVSVVLERLKQRGAPQTVKDISELAEAELSASEQVSKAMSIPLVRLTSPSKESLICALRDAAILNG
ncbi:MAG: ATP-binding protein [Alcanivoracaceae bacterium]|nr:ATP-binding protein [Alcanivoracaceae bacterium]